jgi:hypothetical protein
MSGSLSGALSDSTTSSTPDVKAPRRRRFWPIGVGLAILIALFAVFALQGGDGDGGGGPLNAIAQAAVKTQNAGGGRATIQGVITKPDQAKPLALTGHLVYDASGVSQGTVLVSDPKSGDSMKLELVQDETDMYMRSSKFGTLPDGREWMGLDLSLGGELDESIPAGGDARGELELLEKATGGVEKVGKESVRGVPTTRYRGEISISESAERLREEGGESAAAFIEKKGAPLQVEAWIDARGLVRRMGVAQSKPGEEGEGPTTTDLHVDYFDFGTEPEIDVPDSSEVFDATSLVQDQLDAAADE